MLKKVKYILAFCNRKIVNGAIGVDPNGYSCGKIFKAAKLSGYMTGLVVTPRITHDKQL
jgi:alkaline phosphatase